MQTLLPADMLSDEERTAEAAEILAAGLIRLRNAQQDSDFPLDFLPTGSVHHDRYHNGEEQR
ncbi:hypothetical protein TspCOW1_01800 [Thiohalobacter sp. COW1]|uniref:hypothetical protein n=1 Tax=Thiohalobacter sp. COW1 TaxID=2795687 RepID=UPI00191614CA|nr:hypothetical protein [Thiohalobacter sp. COW1]BCO30077.1 hypothetical protein TspCOW1_01800 [Thiohalobacter sp. COW1]